MNVVRVEGVDRIVAELDRAISRALPEVTKVVERGAFNIKKDWQARWNFGKGSHVRVLRYTVTYDIVTVPGAIEAIIGPDKNRKQGPLGNLLEFGSPTSAPHPGGSPALDAEAPKFEKALDAVLEKLLP